MFKSLKKFLKVYPLPIFVLLLSFVIYYFAFELLRTRGIHLTPQTEADSMRGENNPIITSTIEPIQPTQSNVAMQSQEIETPPVQEPLDEPQIQPMKAPKIYLSTNAKSLNIRQEPNTTSAIVGRLTPADQIILVEDKGEWIYVADSNSEKPLGWIMKRFSYKITPQTQDQEVLIPEIPNNAQELLAPAPIPTNKVYLTSNVRSLNIRQEPNATAPIIGKLTPSHKALLLEQRGEWILIGTSEEGKVLGWILKSYTQEIPQEIMISETRNVNSNQISTESQINANVPQAISPTPVSPTPTHTNIESQTLSQIQSNQADANTPIQSTQSSPIYTSRVPSLNIRELPSTDTPIVGKLTPNDSVIIVETRDVWVRILDANTPSIKNGWVVRRSLIERQ